MVRPKTTILGSRQQLCLNPAVSKLPAAAANQACRSEVSHRSCSWYTTPSLCNLNPVLWLCYRTPHFMLCHVDQISCALGTSSGLIVNRYNRVEPFLQRYPDTNHEPLEIEQLVRLGTARGPCPFYLAREMTRNAELVFMPYNYLIDGRTRAGLSMLSLENAVLIFDEAHNVEVRLPVSLGLQVPLG